MMGRSFKPLVVHCPSSASLAGQLNAFLTHFNNNILPITSTPAPLSPPTQAVTISEHLVASILCNVYPNKVAGPDRLKGMVLKDCSIQLWTVYQVVLAPLGLGHRSKIVEGVNHHSYLQKHKTKRLEDLQTNGPDFHPL